MFIVSALVLKILAGLIWYIGGIVLLLKGKSLISQALLINAAQLWPFAIAGLGIIIGVLKARYLFIKNGRRNLARINALSNPKLWQFFRLRFFIFLTLMIITGALLSAAAQNNYHFLLAVAGLDFSLATALFISGYVYFEKA